MMAEETLEEIDNLIEELKYLIKSRILPNEKMTKDM